MSLQIEAMGKSVRCKSAVLRFLWPENDEAVKCTVIATAQIDEGGIVRKKQQESLPLDSETLGEALQAFSEVAGKLKLPLDISKDLDVIGKQGKLELDGGGKKKKSKQESED